MKKVLVMFMLIFLSISFVGSIDWTSSGIIFIESPANNTVMNLLNNTQIFSGNSSTQGEVIRNISLYHNFNGTWVLNQTINVDSGSPTSPTNQTGVTVFSNTVSDSPRNQPINITNGTVLLQNVVAITQIGTGSAPDHAVIKDTTGTIIANTSDANYVELGSDDHVIFTFDPPILLEGGNTTYTMSVHNKTSATVRTQFDSGNTPIQNEFIRWEVIETDRIWSFVSVQIDEANSSETNWTFSSPVPFGQNFTWGVEGCASDNTCGFNINQNFTISNNLISASTFNSNVFETDSEFFQINLTSEKQITSGILVWNGTSRASTLTSQGNNYSLTNKFDIPLTNGTVSLNWNITFADGGVNETAISTQDVTTINLSLLNVAPQNFGFINFTFKNETTTEENVNANIPRSTFTYFLGTGLVNKTYTFTEASELNNYTLAFSPSNRSVNVTLDLDYDNSVSQQRTYNPSGLFHLTNTTKEQVLFLLPTSEGIFVTFQVINLAQQSISGANVKLTKSGNLISETQTSASGTTNVFLNPNSQYTLNVSKLGYTEFVTTQAFPTSEFTITLGSSFGGTNESYSQGVHYKISPPPLLLQNNTDVNFSFEVNSTYLDLDQFGFSLTNSSGDLLAANNVSSGVNFGKVSITNNTGDNSQIVMNYFWVVDGNYVNGTTTWGVTEFGEGSIVGFINRLKTYLDNGIFGANSFTKSLIIFLAIFLITGTLSYKFGLRSPEAIMVIGALTIMLFDIGLNLLDFGFPNSFPHVASFMAILLTVVVWLGRNG